MIRQRARSGRRGSWALFPSFLVLLCLISLSCLRGCAAIEAQWTPNDQDDGGGPLPLSSKQRQQLLQLEDAIRNSPNPQQTLQQVAESNQMPAEELLNLLERNRRDIDAAGGLAPQHPPRVSVLWKLLTSVSVLITQTASKHPRSFAISITAIMCISYIAVSLPRTGLVLSSGRTPFLSNGPTTVWSPPAGFVRRKFLDNSSKLHLSVSAAKKRDFATIESLLSSSDDGGHGVWKKIPKNQNSEWQYIASAQTVIDASDFVSEDVGDDESVQDEVYQEAVDTALDMILEHASNVLSSCELSEFVDPHRLLRVIASDGAASKRREVVLVVEGMGNFKRFGLQRLRVTHQRDNSPSAAPHDGVDLTLSSLENGHFDGHLHVSIDRKRGSNHVSIRSSLVFPKGGRKLSKTVAVKVVEAVNKSVETSIRTRTRQSLARRSQSSRFQGKAQKAAKHRRKTRLDKEQALEEMAADRRRRWQRQNPNAGHYRPSGERQRSPKNAMY